MDYLQVIFQPAMFDDTRGYSFYLRTYGVVLHEPAGSWQSQALAPSFWHMARYLEDGTARMLVYYPVVGRGSIPPLTSSSQSSTEGGKPWVIGHRSNTLW